MVAANSGFIKEECAMRAHKIHNSIHNQSKKVENVIALLASKSLSGDLISHQEALSLQQLRELLIDQQETMVYSRA